MYFDPFGKRIDLINADDLKRLREVAEGWCVEYKQRSIRAKDVGKSLGAFSNHLGGWLIFGVEAPDRMPTAFPGLDQTAVREVMNSLRDAACGHVNPAVLFETAEIPGPCDSIGLLDQRCIVIVRVPQGQNPPYIHSSGRIYRRIADSSDPKPETDRAVIDQLTQRAREYQERFKKFIETKPEFSENESSMPVLQVLLTTDRWSERGVKRVLKHGEFAEIMARKDDANSTIALESAFPSGFGFTARHVAENDPFDMSYTWQFSYGGFSSVVVPLRTLDEGASRHYKYIADFLPMLSDSLRDRTIDATLLRPFLTSVFAKHDALAKALGIDGALFVKFRFLNVWRRVPYVDTQAFVDHVRSHGIPVIQRSEQTVPPGTTPHDMLEIRQVDEGKVKFGTESVIRAGGVLHLLLGAIGIPNEVVRGDEVGAFFDAIQRAIALHGAPRQAR